jgi:hypothetical protein
MRGAFRFQGGDAQFNFGHGRTFPINTVSTSLCWQPRSESNDHDITIQRLVVSKNQVATRPESSMTS